MANDSPTTNKKSDKSILDTLQDFFSGLLGSTDPDKEKKRLLKEIKRELKKRNRFFRTKGNMALAGLAKAFYEMYITVGPAQILFEKYSNSEVLKEFLIESFFNDRQKTALESLQPEKLKERAQTSDLKKLKEEVKQDLVLLYSALDINAIKKINSLYNSMIQFRDFLTYDFHFFLKKFDSLLPEQDFNYQPRFENINGEYIIEDLKDFLVVLTGLNDQADWDYLFDVIKEYRNIDLVSRDRWKKLLSLKREMVQTKILNYMVMHLDQDPYYKVKIDRPNFEIVEPYLNKRKTDVEKTLQEVFLNKKNQQINNMLLQVFGTTAISRTINYTEKESFLIEKKVPNGYVYVKPVNYLKAFFLDYYKNDIRKLIDTLLIHGKWATSVLSQQLSDTFHHLMQYTDTLIEFDNSLAEDGPLGVRVKRILRAAGKDRSAQSALGDAVGDVNDKALRIINHSAQSLISLGKYIKNLITDHKAMKSQLIINWKELESVTNNSIDEQMEEVYRKIYYFIQLLQYYVKPKEQPSKPVNQEKDIDEP
jgi:hypothetical protein